MANPWVAREERFENSLKSSRGNKETLCAFSALNPDLAILGAVGHLSRIPVCILLSLLSERVWCFRLCVYLGVRKGKAIEQAGLDPEKSCILTFASWSGIGGSLVNPLYKFFRCYFPVLVQALISCLDHAKSFLLSWLPSPISLESSTMWGHFCYYTESPILNTPFPCRHISLQLLLPLLSFHKASWTSLLSLVLVFPWFWRWCSLLSFSLSSLLVSVPWQAAPPSPGCSMLRAPQGLVLKQLLISVWSSQDDLIQSQSSKYHPNANEWLCWFYVFFPGPRLIPPLGCLTDTWIYLDTFIYLQDRTLDSLYPQTLPLYLSSHPLSIFIHLFALAKILGVLFHSAFTLIPHFWSVPVFGQLVCPHVWSALPPPTLTLHLHDTLMCHLDNWNSLSTDLPAL